MTESSLPWGAIAYTDDDWTDIWRQIFTRDRTLQGVIATDDSVYDGMLEVTNPSGTTIRVDTGLALVDGKLYRNTASVDNSVTAPGSGSNYYTIVLRKSWSGKSVTVEMLGPDTGSPPSPTQTDGTTWEISLATVRITSGSSITVTDARVFVNRGAEKFTLIPAYSAYNDTAAGEIEPDLWGGYIFPDSADCSAFGVWAIPDDVVSDLSIGALLRIDTAPTSDDLYILIGIAYGAIGGSYDQNDDSTGLAAITNAVTYVGQLVNILDTSLSAPDVGDMVTLLFRRDATDPLDTHSASIKVMGFLATYLSA